MGDRLLPAVARLPKGSGVIFRHYSLPRREREALLCKLERVTRRRRLTLLMGGEAHARKSGAITAPVHSIPQRIAAERAGARLLFVSPVFATRSHPQARPLGRVKFGMLIRGAKCPVIALGGMNPRRARVLAAFGIHGWAGIDAFG